jgi:5-methylcytosine-specific restriction endonuclease McrA
MLRKTSLKEMWIVRYADDFKIFTNDARKAKKIYEAVKEYLKDHLRLEISPEKSKVVNLRKRSSVYLGFTIKANKKGKKYVAHTHIAPKKQERITKELTEKIKQIQKKPNHKNMNAYNSYVMGIKNYYQVATHVSIDLAEIGYRLSRTLYNRFKSIGKYEKPKSTSMTYKKFNSTGCKTYRINGNLIFPIAGIKTKNNLNFSQAICNYTETGRSKKHKNLDETIYSQLRIMMANPITSRTIEYNDNRLSKYSCQQGLCQITGIPLLAKYVHCHHKIPKYLGGTDKFENLMIIHKNVHRLIHATKERTIKRYLSLLQLNVQQLKKVNEYRKICNLTEVVNN